MTPDTAASQTTIVLSKPTRPMNEYHIFFQLERNYIIQSSGDTEVTPERGDNIDTESALRPPRYRSLILPQGWHTKGCRSKCRSRRKSHGKISFLDLTKVISQRWREVDQVTKDYCRDLADRELSRYREEMDAYVERFGEDAIQMVKEQKKKQKYFKKMSEIEKRKEAENKAKEDELIQENIKSQETVAATQALVSKALALLQSNSVDDRKDTQQQGSTEELTQQLQSSVDTMKARSHPSPMHHYTQSSQDPRPTFGVSQEGFVRKVSGDTSEALPSFGEMREQLQDMETASAITFDDGDDDSSVGPKNVSPTSPAAARPPLCLTNGISDTDSEESFQSPNDDDVNAELMSPLRDYGIEPDVDFLAQNFVDKYAYFLEEQETIIDGTSSTKKESSYAATKERGTDGNASSKMAFSMVKSTHDCSPCPSAPATVVAKSVETSKRGSCTLGAAAGLHELSEPASKRAKQLPPPPVTSDMWRTGSSDENVGCTTHTKQ